MKEKDLLTRLSEYSQSDFYPFHMPGHKRNGFFTRDGGFPDPYSIDITEIDGFDNLHHPEGVLKESMEWAAGVYGANRTYYLVNGSTCGILSAICGTVPSGGKLLMARNCHKSAYNGLILNRLTPEYVYPETVGRYGILGSVSPEAVARCLEKDENHEIRAVFLVSPTYEGVVSDIKRIAEVVHEHGIPLIVDEAHGAHLPFAKEGDGFPASALDSGADLVIQSLHKTLPSFTQTAVLHVQGKLADRERVEQYLGMFQSSSPSYLFMAGIERCLRFMDRQGREEMSAYGKRMEQFFLSLSGLEVLEVMDRSVIGERGVFDWDCSKIVVFSGKAEGLSGEKLGRILRENYHLEMEMCAPEYVVAMTSLLDTKEGLLRLKEALLEIDKGLSGKKKGKGSRIGSGNMTETAEMCMIPAKALELPGRRVSTAESAGCISKEFVYLYPPGIPILVPGERISKEAVSRILEYQAEGLSVQGTSDPSVSTILAVAGGEGVC